MKPGEFYKFTPDYQHCTEGIAAVEENGTLHDTFWGSAYDNPLSQKERETMELMFRSADYDELKDSCANGTWQQFHPNDRQRVTSQHGLQARYFVRKGAMPDLPTKIENARLKVVEAESTLRSAEHSLKWAQRELDELLRADREVIEP